VEAKRSVLLLTPLLRIADSLDRGHAQRVKDIASVAKNGVISLLVEAGDDADLEIWAANEAAKTFEETYSKMISVQRARSSR
jgi:hypothetical protein